MTVSSLNPPVYIFDGTKLKRGVYRVQNVRCQTYLDILPGNSSILPGDSSDLCCRPAADLSPRDALWEFRPSGSGYHIKKFCYGPAKYCNVVEGMFSPPGATVSVTASPAVWRVEVVPDFKFELEGIGNVQIFFGVSYKVLDLPLWGSRSRDNVKVKLCDFTFNGALWKLIPAYNEGPRRNK